MSIRHVLQTAALAGAVGIPGRVVAQATVKLDRPTASPSEVFSVVNDVVELSPERILVADEKERRLVILDVTTGLARNIGRVGSGPGEFRAIGALFERPGGAWLSDFAQRRLLPVNADGTFGTPITFPISIMLSAADTRGAVYGDGFMPNLSARSDSMYMLRWTPETGRVDTLGKYDAGVTKSTGPGNALHAYAFHDTWTPLADGTIALVFARSYGIGMMRDGRVTSRVAIPYEPRRITEADKAAFRRKIASQPVRAIGSGGATASPPPMPVIEFGDVFPPFGGMGLGGSYTRRARNGDVWIARTRSERDSVQSYDVVDAAQGKLLLRVAVAPRSALVGFGAGSVYVAERDADDVVVVRRYAYPVAR